MTHVADDEKAASLPRRRPTSSKKLETLSICLRFWGTCAPQLQKPLYGRFPRPDSIRLLRISPGKPGQMIRCSLQNARLDDTLPSYEALSYVWAPQDIRTGEHTIRCGRHRKEVGANLFDALERLRYPDQPRLIWVDALCINQTDSVEKTQQVRLMNHVYRRATRVLVWLGKDTHDEARPAFATLCTVVNARQIKSKARVRRASYDTIDKSYKLHTVVCIHTQPPPDSKEWTKVLALLINDWWTRMWVLQEIVLAQSATFIWGSAELDWTIMQQAISCIRQEPYLLRSLENRGLQNAHLMSHLAQLQLSELNDTHPFLHLLDMARSFDVGDPKDKVYGLLGFPTRDASAENANGVFIQPNYEPSVAEIYTDVAWKILKKEQNLDILSFTSHTNPQFDEDMKMPSWVPDWNSRDVITPFQCFGAAHKHRAGTGKKLPTLSSNRPEILCVKGVLVDRVMDITPSTPFIDILDADPYLRGLIAWCMGFDVNPSVLAMTLTARRGTDGTLTQDSEQILADFCAFLLDLDASYIVKKWPNEAARLVHLAHRKGNPETARELVWRYMCYRAGLVTGNSRLGLGPGATGKGDVIVVLWGGQVPYILRKVEREQYWRFIGECYVEGFMNGEIVERFNEGLDEEMVFELR